MWRVSRWHVLSEQRGSGQTKRVPWCLCSGRGTPKSGKEGMRVDGRRKNLNLEFLPSSWELSCGVGQRWRGRVSNYHPPRSHWQLLQVVWKIV